MYTLLLVDDEPVIRMTFRNLLPWDDTPWRIAGMVANGEEALDFLKKCPVDIVITDMMMPQMNGLELIRHLRKQQFAGAILVLSNYSDFSLVRQAMQLGARDYMLKADMEAESLRDALTRLSENLAPFCSPLEPGEAVMPDDYRRTLLRELMLGYALPENAVQSGGELLPHAPYRLLYVALDRSDERTTARKSIRNVLLANFSEQTDVLCLGEQEHICLIPAAQADEAALVRRGVQLVRQLKIYLDCRANVLVSAAFPDTDGMCHQLARCRSDARVFFYEAREGCLTVGGIVFSPLQDEPRPEEAAQQLAECFDHGPDHADAWVQALLDRCAARHVNPDSLMNYVFHIIQTLLMNHPQAPESTVFASHVEVLSCKSASHLLGLLRTLLPSLMETPASQIDSGNSDVRTLVLYLQKHYAEHISLDTLSATVNLNRSYLCRLFKRETGESLFQYLARLRLEKATSLLAQDRLPVREVAARVGIDDPFYFTRMFKKQYGVAPSEYVSQMKATESSPDRKNR